MIRLDFKQANIDILKNQLSKVRERKAQIIKREKRLMMLIRNAEHNLVGLIKKVC